MNADHFTYSLFTENELHDLIISVLLGIMFTALKKSTWFQTELNQTTD